MKDRNNSKYLNKAATGYNKLLLTVWPLYSHFSFPDEDGDFFCLHLFFWLTVVKLNR